MAWKSSSIVSYPDSDDDNDPLHYIKKSRPKQDNVQYTPVYKNKVGNIVAGHPRDPRLQSRNRDPRLQPKVNETRDPRLYANRDPRTQSEEGNVHYEPVYNRKVRDIARELDNASRANSYESAGARWKQYKSEKAAEISKPDKYQSAESGWKKLKSENKWNTSHWTQASDSSDEEEDNYNRKTPKSKIDIFSNSQERDDEYPEEKSRGNDFWWKYKDDDPVVESYLLENASKPEEKNDDLFDDILSGNLAESTKSAEKNDDFNDDFLYEDVLMQSRKVLEEGKAFLGETVKEQDDRGKDHSPVSYERIYDKSRNHSSSDFRSEDHMLREKNYSQYHNHQESEDKTENHLYKRVDNEFEDNDETWARSITVEKRDESNWSDESLSPIRRDEPTEDRDVEVNLVKKKSPSRPRNGSPSGHDSKKKRRKDEKVSNHSPLSREPRKMESTQPVIMNPYDNPKLNVDNINKYFDDLMEWNYSHRCLICDKTFENLTKWTEHILDTKHGREFHLDPYRCPPCHEMFRNKQDWKMHMAYAPSHGFMGSINVPKPCTALPPSPAFPIQHGWRCKSCYIISQTDEDAIRHIKYVHLIHSAQYPCPLCGEPFWHQRDLDRHADDVHAPPKYQCDICRRAFESGEKLQTHRLIKHSKKITCYRCEKQIDELIFKEHCEMHKLEKRKCDYCGDVFKDSYHLDKHIRNDHKKRHRYRSASRSPDRRSSRRRSRRSSSRSRRSSSKSRKNSARDDQRKKEEKSAPSGSPTRKEEAKEISKELERSRSQDDSSIPSSNCATPTRDEEEDIFPPGDENYRQSSPKLNTDIKEAAPEDEHARRDKERSPSRSPRGRRDSREDYHRSREKDRSSHHRRSRSRSRSFDSRERRSYRSEKSGSRDQHSSRRYYSEKRSRSRSRERQYDSRERLRSDDNYHDYGSQFKDRGLEDSRDKDDKDDSRNKDIDKPDNTSLNPQDDVHNEDEEETEWERKISVKMVVQDEIWEKEEDEKSNGVSNETTQKDLPIFDIPVEEDTTKSSPENPVENATWVVEKPLDDHKDTKSENEGDEEEKKQFVCKECGKSLGSLMQLRDHFTVKHKKGYNLRNKKTPTSDVKKSQPVVPKEPKLSEEQKEIAKLIEGIE
jgi:uncharacterized C2H2 Zn-finger protein